MHSGKCIRCSCTGTNKTWSVWERKIRRSPISIQWDESGNQLSFKSSVQGIYLISKMGHYIKSRE